MIARVRDVMAASTQAALMLSDDNFVAEAYVERANREMQRGCAGADSNRLGHGVEAGESLLELFEFRPKTEGIGAQNGGDHFDFRFGNVR